MNGGSCFPVQDCFVCNWLRRSRSCHRTMATASVVRQHKHTLMNARTMPEQGTRQDEDACNRPALQSEFNACTWQRQRSNVRDACQLHWVAWTRQRMSGPGIVRRFVPSTANEYVGARLPCSSLWPSVCFYSCLGWLQRHRFKADVRG